MMTAPHENKWPLWEELIFSTDLKFAKIFIKPPPKLNEVKSFKLVFRKQWSTIVNFCEESKLNIYDWLQPLNNYTANVEDYSISRIQIWDDFSEILQNFKSNLEECWKDSQKFGDNLRAGFWNDALDTIDQLKKDINYVERILNLQTSIINTTDIRDNLYNMSQKTINWKQRSVYKSGWLSETQK